MGIKIFAVIIFALVSGSAASWVTFTRPPSIRSLIQQRSAKDGNQICTVKSKRDICGLCREERMLLLKTYPSAGVILTNQEDITVSLSLKSNLSGCAEFRICQYSRESTRLNNLNCARQEALYDQTRSRTMFHFEPAATTAVIRLKVPQNMNCSSCVLQMKYFAGMDMKSGPTNVRTIYDCASIIVKEANPRVRRQVTGQNLNGVIFGPNRPQTRIRFSDMPLSANVITVRQRQEVRPLTIHRIVMATETNQTSEIKSENNNGASVKVLTLSRTGETRVPTASGSNTLTSRTNENQAASGSASKLIIVRKSEPTNANTVLVNTNRELAPSSSNVLLTANRNDLVKTDAASGSLNGAAASANSNVVISSTHTSQQNDNSMAKGAPIGGSRLLSVTRIGNGMETNTGLQPSMSVSQPAASNLYVLSGNTKQINMTSVSREPATPEPQRNSALLITTRKVTPMSMNTKIITENRQPAAVLPTLSESSSEQIKVRLNNVSDIQSRLPSVNARLEIMANQRNINNYVETPIATNTRRTVYVRENNTGVSNRVLNPGKQEQVMTGTVGTLSGRDRQGTANTAIHSVRVQTAIDRLGPSIATQGNLKNTNTPVNNAQSDAPQIRSNMFIVTRTGQRENIKTTTGGSVQEPVPVIANTKLSARRDDASTLNSMRWSDSLPSASGRSKLLIITRKYEKPADVSQSEFATNVIKTSAKDDVNTRIINAAGMENSASVRENINKMTNVNVIGNEKAVSGSNNINNLINVNATQKELSTSARKLELGKVMENEKSTSLRDKDNRVALNAIKNENTAIARDNADNLIAFEVRRNPIFASTDDNARKLLNVKAMENINSPIVNSKFVNISREHSLVNINGGSGIPKDKSTASSSNMLTITIRQTNVSGVMYNNAPVSSVNNISAPFVNLKEAVNYTDLSNYSDTMTTSIPLEWMENGTYYDNSSYFSNYTGYSNLSYYSNETFYPEYGAMFENETLFGNYSYDYNQTFYSENETMYNNQTSYIQGGFVGNITVRQESEIPSTSVKTKDISITPTVVKTAITKTATEFAAFNETVLGEIGWNDKATMSNSLTPKSITTRITETPTDITTSGNLQSVILDKQLNNVSNISVIIDAEPEPTSESRPTTNTDYLLVTSSPEEAIPVSEPSIPVSDPSIPVSDPSVSGTESSGFLTTTDKYSNINLNNLMPGSVSYLPDYKTSVDDYGGVPILMGNTGALKPERDGTIKIDEIKPETSVVDDKLKMNTMDTNNIYSDETLGLTNVDSKNNILINTIPRTDNSNIVHTPKVVIAYENSYPDDLNSVAIGTLDDKTSSAVGTSVQVEGTNSERSLEGGVTDSDSLITNIIKKLNIVTNTQEEEKMPAVVTNLALKSHLDSSLASKSSDTQMPPIEVPYPFGSKSVAIGMGLINSNKRDDKEIRIVGTPVKLESGFEPDFITSTDISGFSSNGLKEPEVLQTDGVDLPPIIVPKNVALPSGSTQRDSLSPNVNTVTSKTAVENSAGSWASETDNMYIQGIAPRIMPPISIRTQKPRNVIKYPGYKIIDMVNTNKALKTSFNLFDANEMKNSKRNKTLAEAGMGRDLSVGFNNILYPIESVRPDYVLSKPAKIASSVKTVWKGPGITSLRAISTADKTGSTVSSKKLIFKRPHPPAIRPKQIVTDLSNQNISNQPRKATAITTNNVVNSISDALTISKLQTNTANDFPTEANEVKTSPLEITPEYIASINKDIQLINDRLLNSIQQNIKSKSEMTTGTDVIKRSESNVTTENVKILSTDENNTPVLDSKLIANGRQSNNSAVEQTDILHSKSVVLNEETTLKLQKAKDLLLNKSANSAVSELNSAQFDDISLKILRTLERILQELQLNRNLAFERRNLLVSKESSINTAQRNINSIMNNINLTKKIPGNSFDLAQNVPGIETKIGNVKTLATNLDLFSRRLSGEKGVIGSNPVWQVHPSLLAVSTDKSQRGVNNFARAGRQGALPTGNLFSMADIRPWPSQQDDITILRTPQQVNTTERVIKDMFNQEMSMNDVSSLRKNNLKLNRVEASPQPDSYRVLSEFVNPKPLARVGIPVAFNTEPVTSVPEYMTGNLASESEAPVNLQTSDTFQLNVNQDKPQLELDAYNITNNGIHNGTKVLQKRVNGTKESGQANIYENLLWAAINNINSHNKQANDVYSPEYSNMQSTGNDLLPQNQVYDLSGLTEEQKSQITRGLSKAYVEPTIESQTQSNAGFDIPIYYCPNGERFSCKALGTYDGIPGMEWWCFNHCRNGPCPKTKCQCTCNPQYNENAFNVGYTDMQSKKTSQAIELPTNNTENTLNSTGDEGVMRKKIWTKVITLTLNGSKENAVQVNDMGPEFMVSRAPEIIKTTVPDRKIPSSVRDSHNSGQSLIKDYRKVGLGNEALLNIKTAENTAADARGIFHRDLTLATSSRDQIQPNGKSRLVVIDNRLVCRGTGKFENIEGIMEWCTIMCRQAICPEFVCTCWS